MASYRAPLASRAPQRLADRYGHWITVSREDLDRAER